MKTNDIIKYVLMAAAAWFLYRWLEDNGYLGGAAAIPGGGGSQQQLPPQNTQQPGQTQPPQNQQQQPPSNQGPGSNVPPGGGGVSSGSLKDQLWNAAKNEANPNAGLLHFWQWNHYLPSNVARPDPFAMTGWAQTPLGRQPVSIEDVETTPLSIDQYWALVQPILAPGMSGVARPGQSNLSGVNHWNQQSSQWAGGPGNSGGGMSGFRGRSGFGGGL
jgi:hypothetical protein